MDTTTTAVPTRSHGAGGFPATGEIKALAKRGITEETCRKFGYRTGDFHGSPVQIAPYCDDSGAVIAQKLRFAGKTFSFIGEAKKAGLFGQHLWRDNGKKIVITEGEIDALTVSQLQNNKWPVVSLPNGAAAARKSLAHALDYLEKFDEVVLMFDNDEPGRKAVAECAELFTPGKCKVAWLPLKDANEMLVAGRGAEVIQAMWDAKVYRPDGIIDGADITVEQLTEAPAFGYSTGYPALDAVTRGVRKAEMTLFTAGTGIGKSTIVREIGYHLSTVHGLKIGNIFLEESFKKTAQAYVAIDKNIPLGDLRSNPQLLSAEQYEASLAKTVKNGSMWFYNHFGSLESENLLAKIKYMASGLGVDFILLDHLSIAVSGQESSRDGERKDIDRLMTHLRSIVEQTGVGLITIAHLSKADGKPHEEGGRVSLNDLRGSASLKQIPDCIIALERDQQGDDPNGADVRVLKNREYGDVGLAGRVSYNKTTGRLLEVPIFGGTTSSSDESIPF